MALRPNPARRALLGLSAAVRRRRWRARLHIVRLGWAPLWGAPRYAVCLETAGTSLEARGPELGRQIERVRRALAVGWTPAGGYPEEK